MIDRDLAQLLSDIAGADLQRAIAAARELASRREASAVPHMLRILQDTDNASVRDALALALSDLKEPAAFDAIVALVKSDRTMGHRGTLLYALGAYDCAPILPLLVSLVIEGNYEVSRQALALIEGIDTEVDDRTWQTYVERLQTALEVATEDRRPLLERLKEMFAHDG